MLFAMASQTTSASFHLRIFGFSGEQGIYKTLSESVTRAEEKARVRDQKLE